MDASMHRQAQTMQKTKCLSHHSNSGCACKDIKKKSIQKTDARPCFRILQFFKQLHCTVYKPSQNGKYSLTLTNGWNVNIFHCSGLVTWACNFYTYYSIIKSTNIWTLKTAITIQPVALCYSQLADPTLTAIDHALLVTSWTILWKL